ncbi:MAG: NotI family restriction endonuclease [Pseudomonadota bacterium]
MAATIFEFFGYRADDRSDIAKHAADTEVCPISGETCQKSFNDGVVSGVCAIKPITSEPVICCPIRLYADDYRILSDIADRVFGPNLKLVAGRDAVNHSIDNREACVAVFGKGWGGELRLPQKSKKGGYFVDWVLAKISEEGDLVEFVAVEVQTIDTTGTYRPGYDALKQDGLVEKTTAGLNWENVAKRILPQLIYKGQILQREELCKSGLFFVCPEPVFRRIMERLGGQEALVRYALQPASITFAVYDYDFSSEPSDETLVPLKNTLNHSTTVYKVQEAFNNVTLPIENVYRDAIRRALGIESE